MYLQQLNNKMQQVYPNRLKELLPYKVYGTPSSV